jgi:hypothetical protein
MEEKKGKCYHEKDCKDLMSGGNVSKDTCDAANGKSWKPQGGSCVNL